MRSPRHLPVLLPVLLFTVLAAAFAAYSPGLSGPFLLDDAVNLPRTALSSLDWRELKDWISWDSKLGGWSRSLTNLSFGLTQLAAGMEPAAFKYQNTLLHLLNGTLVFWLTFLLFGRVLPNPLEAHLLALSVAAVWLLHPLQVSTTLYAVQRLVLLSTLFVLLALITYVKGRIWGFRRPLAGFMLAVTGATLFGTLGVLSKENAVLLPLYICAIELFFFRFAASSLFQRRLLYVLLGLLVAVPALSGGAYAVTHLDSLVGGYRRRDFTLEERLLTQPHVLALYLKLFFAPLPASMSLFHDNFPIQRQFDLPTGGLILAYLALVAGALWSRTTAYAAIGFGVLWFFLCHALESTFVSLEMVFEHRNYLAILGPSIVLVLGISRLLASPNLQRIAPALILGLVAMLAFNTAARAFVWSNGELMLRTEYMQRPDSPRVLNGLYELEMRRGRIDEARRYLSEAQALAPDSPRYLVDMLRTYCNAEAVPERLVAQTLEAASRHAVATGLFGALEALTSTHLTGACPTVDASTVSDLLSVYARSSEPLTNRTRSLAFILNGRLLVSEKRWDEAEAAYITALDLVGGQFPSYVNLTVNDLFAPFLLAGRIDSLGRMLAKVAAPAAEDR